MEHRWGQRLVVGAPIRLRGASFGSVPGQLRDASISGAFIETGLKLEPLTRVDVELRPGHSASWKVPAFVIRSDPEGIAVEWRMVASEAVLTRLGRLVRRPSGGTALIPAGHFRPAPAALPGVRTIP